MEDLVRFGILAESLTYPDLPMAEAIDKILATPSLNLTELLPRGIGIPDEIIENPAFVLTMLKSTLETLPHDTSTIVVTTVVPIMTVLVLATTAGRFWARMSLGSSFRSEDWWALIATVVTVAMMAMWIVPTLPTERINSAEGKHVWDISFNHFSTSLMLQNSTILIFAVGNFIVKIQFLVFYYSLSPSKLYRRLLLAAGLVILAIAAATVLGLIFQCDPFNYWDHLFTAKCIDRFKFLAAVGWATLASDIILLIIPISLVLNLDKMKLGVKLQVIAIFGAGALVCVACVGRVLSVEKLIIEVDASYNTPVAAAWGTVELNLSNIIANVPTLKLFLSRKSRARRDAKELSRTHEEIQRSAFRRRLGLPPKFGIPGSVYPISKRITESNTAWTMNDLGLDARDPDKGVEALAESSVRKVEQGDEEQGTIHVRVMVSQHIAQRSEIERILDRQEMVKTNQ